MFDTNMESMVEQPTMTSAHSAVSFEQKENDIRTWIASREGVCPYAPGIARFTYLPSTLSLDLDSVRYASEELSAFYRAKDKNRKVLRWMLLPEENWLSHDQAKQQAEQLYWLFAAAYFYLRKDKKRMSAALNADIKGVDRGINGEIINPIVGELAKTKHSTAHPRSLFCTALGPAYESKDFYRWSPHSMLVMVYAKDFMKKKRHVDVVAQITREMVQGNLLELWGEKARICVRSIEKELPFWEQIIETALRYAQTKQVDMQSICSVMSAFKSLNPSIVNQYCSKNLLHLPVLNCLAVNTGQSYFTLLNSLYSGSGLYVEPRKPLGSAE